jgi:hypothetical protein
MKKLFILLLISYSANSQIVNIPDPNFKNAILLQNPDIDANNDGEIQVSEAEATDDLSVNGANINDLTGIEAFINITFLDCSSNNLTSIDVSNNTALEIFECYENQLTTIDISNNPEIYQFECRFNQLTTIDIGNNPNLVLLSIGDNNIPQLDLGNNPSLFILECRNMPIQELDLSNNTVLESLVCTDNDALTYINLKNGNNGNFEYSGVFASNFENLPALETVCLDDVNSTLADFILAQVDHSVTFTEDCNLGNQENELNTIALYPVPVHNILYLESKNAIITAEIYSMLGQNVMRYSNASGITELDTAALHKGIYLAVFMDADNTITTMQILKD